MPKVNVTPEQLVKERIDRDLAEHQITVLHADGLYRHWRCQKLNEWNLWFDIVTWPGSLCIEGDMGTYIFSRTKDMVSFMRSSCMSYDYAAEKCKAHDGRLREFREERFEMLLTEAEACDDDTLTRQEQYEFVQKRKEKTQEIRNRYRERSEDPSEARWAMYESGLWDGSDMPSCEDFTYHFLWCLHAIKWFCEKIEAKP